MVRVCQDKGRSFAAWSCLIPELAFGARRQSAGALRRMTLATPTVGIAIDETGQQLES